MLWFLDNADAGGAAGPLVDALLGRAAKGGRIRCPKCAWQPRSSDRWFCSKCRRASWNTFDTRGVCPVCAFRWTWTACLRCHQWSLHEAWYERADSA